MRSKAIRLLRFSGLIIRDMRLEVEPAGLALVDVWSMPTQLKAALPA
jgi:hypothetical protein